jgi:hypothetical protein
MNPLEMMLVTGAALLREFDGLALLLKKTGAAS